MKSVIVSVVLYRHSLEKVLPTINSILSSDVVKRLILVDNSDCQWARKMGDPRVVYVKSSSNQGYGHGHNQAINKFAAESDYYLVCNPDVEFSSDVLKKLIEVAEQCPAGLFMPAISNADGSRQEVCRLLPTPLDSFVRRLLPAAARWTSKNYLLQNADFSCTFFAPSLSGCFMFFRKEALLALKGFDERYFMYFEDVDLSRRAAEQFGAVYVGGVSILHHFEQSSYKNNRMFFLHIKSACQYFLKWGWFFDPGRRRLNKICLEGLPVKQ